MKISATVYEIIEADKDTEAVSRPSKPTAQPIVGSSQSIASAQPIHNTNSTTIWKIIKLLGSGAFGDVYRVIKEDDADKKEYAMKTEMADGNKQDLRLKLEVHVLTLCLNIENPQRKKHFLELFDRGKTKQFKFLVMTLVGPTLDDIRRNVLGRNYSRSTAMQLSHQTLESLADLHELGYLHRDIKPQNFAIGLAHCEKTVFILDFGVARKYTVGNTKEIKTPRVRVRFVGSVRFASRACHRYQEQGRKDDMESWLYLVFDMIDSVDGIPWKRFPDRQVLHMKDKLFSDKLPNCYRIVPKEFKRIVQYIDCMMFKEKPDYTYLRHSLNSIAKEHRIDTKKELDWVEKGKKKDNSGTMTVSTVASGVAAVAAIATTVSVITVVYLVNDINNFYDEAIEELTQFKASEKL
ncbi:hypothetical protein Q1695_008294 [Nippostrongylus brasiliensis]|nr:hypothetical protein Q1695_008294 [Nippostrongylus brasiliensis]